MKVSYKFQYYNGGGHPPASSVKIKQGDEPKTQEGRGDTPACAMEPTGKLQRDLQPHRRAEGIGTGGEGTRRGYTTSKLNIRESKLKGRGRTALEKEKREAEIEGGTWKRPTT